MSDGLFMWMFLSFPQLFSGPKETLNRGSQRSGADALYKAPTLVKTVTQCQSRAKQ